MTARARIGLLLTTSSLVLWAGGLILLGAVVAPQVFLASGLAREDAGAVMAPIFLAFDRWILVAMAGLILGEFLRLPAIRPAPVQLVLNLVLLGVLLGTGLGGSLFIDPRIEALRVAGIHRNIGPEATRFSRLHQASETNGRGQVLLCLALLAVSWIPAPRAADIERSEER